jgi:hypothetical protein
VAQTIAKITLLRSTFAVVRGRPWQKRWLVRWTGAGWLGGILLAFVASWWDYLGSFRGLIDLVTPRRSVSAGVVSADCELTVTFGGAWSVLMVTVVG